MHPAAPVRLAGPGDWAAVVACVQDAYAPYVARIGRRPAPMDADYADLIARGAVYVVLESTAVRGVLVLTQQDETVWIENVAVHPRHQRRGFGGCLLRFAERYATGVGVAELCLYTNVQMVENIALYQRIGYHEVERREDHGFQRVFMRKILSASRSKGSEAK